MWFVQSSSAPGKEAVSSPPHAEGFRALEPQCGKVGLSSGPGWVCSSEEALEPGMCTAPQFADPRLAKPGHFHWSNWLDWNSSLCDPVYSLPFMPLKALLKHLPSPSSCTLV